ncbi:MAG: hypothetical protein AB7N53_07740 [Candidatus Binatia bacterium]
MIIGVIWHCYAAAMRIARRCRSPSALEELQLVVRCAAHLGAAMPRRQMGKDPLGNGARFAELLGERDRDVLHVFWEPAPAPYATAPRAETRCGERAKHVQARVSRARRTERTPVGL